MLIHINTFSFGDNLMCKTAFKLFLLSSLVFIGVLNSQTAFSAQLSNFNAKFEVEALGLTLGQAKHSLRCQQQNCTLVSSAKPSGFAAAFFKDSSTETIQLIQNQDKLLWQSYHKLGLTEKNGQTQKKNVNLNIDKNNQVVCLEKNTQWPVKPKMFDLMSIAYAIQHAQLNQQSLTNFVLVDSNFQDELILKSQNKNDFLEFEFSDNQLDAVKYHFISQHAEIELWLLPNYNYFPGKIRIINREDKTITLSLAEPPKTL